MFNEITYSNINFLDVPNDLGSDTGLYINFEEFLIERDLKTDYKSCFYDSLTNTVEYREDVLVNSQYISNFQLAYLEDQAGTHFGVFNDLYCDRACFEIVNYNNYLQILDEIIIHSDNGDYLLRYSHTKEKSKHYNVHDILFKLLKYDKGHVTILVDCIPLYYRNGDKYIYTLLQARDYFKKRIKEYEKRA